MRWLKMMDAVDAVSAEIKSEIKWIKRRFSLKQFENEGVDKNDDISYIYYMNAKLLILLVNSFNLRKIYYFDFFDLLVDLH